MDLTPIEERLAHLERVVDDLSDVVARQDRLIDRLSRQVAALIEREAEREDESRRATPTAPPPHW